MIGTISTSPNLTEVELKQMFVKAVNQVVENWHEIIRDMDQEEYRYKLERLSDRYHKVGNQIAEMKHAIQHPDIARLKRNRSSKQEDVLTGFSNHLWHSLADYAEVHGKDDIRFTCKNGREIRI